MNSVDGLTGREGHEWPHKHVNTGYLLPVCRSKKRQLPTPPQAAVYRQPATFANSRSKLRRISFDHLHGLATIFINQRSRSSRRRKFRSNSRKSSMSSANKVFLFFSITSSPQTNRYSRIRALALNQIRLYTAQSRSGTDSRFSLNHTLLETLNV